MSSKSLDPVLSHILQDEYRPNNSMATYQVCFALGRWALTIWLHTSGYLPLIPFLIIGGLNIMHLFVVFHDMGHNSFFTNTTLNKIGSWILSCWVLTPLYWQLYHKVHHGISGDLNEQWNDSIFYTVEQYNALPKWKQLSYRILRTPIIFFCVGPVLKWFIMYRIPYNFDKPHRELNAFKVFVQSTVNTIGCLLVFSFANATTGLQFWKYVLCQIVGSWFGMLLFHFQHSYNPSYTSRTGWNMRDAALHGSSFQTIPEIMKSWTMGIEYHHIHHYSTQVPGYLLRKCHEDGEKKKLWTEIHTLTYSEMKECFWYTLYDEKKGQYVPF